MLKIKKNTVFFTSGGLGYGVIELLWRGHTHWTMILAGGICFIIISNIAEKCKRRSAVYKASLCALGITAVELVFGVVFNIIFGMSVWDYSKLPLNFLGQICLLYTVMWGILGLAFIPLADIINQKFKEQRSF